MTRDSSPLERAARLILDSKHVVALVGAGLSAESGIPTFRGAGGLWTRVGEPSMNGYEEFLRDPAAWWRHQLDPEADPARTEFRAAIDNANPNAGHRALVQLETNGFLQMTITQNVDNLQTRAGSKRLIEIHGNRTKVRCISCERRMNRDELEYDRLPIHCAACGGLVKGDTVMFGEPIPRSVLDACFVTMSECDVMLVCGTSATVYPAAGFPQLVLEKGGAVIELNPNLTALSSFADVIVSGPTGTTLPALVEAVSGAVS